MSCDQNPEALAAYLDGELSASQQTAIQQHIRGCVSCADEIAQLVSLRRSLIPARTRYTPSADFRQKIRQQSTRTARPFSRFIPWVVPLAAVLLVMIVLVQHSFRKDTLSEVADLHVNALASANPVEVISTDRHTVKPWFQGKLPFSFNIPEFAGSNFTLLGGRLAYLHQQPGAQLIVALGQHKLSILIFQDSAALDGAFPIASNVSNRNSFSMATWRARSLRFFMIGDGDPAQMDRLGELFQRVNQ